MIEPDSFAVLDDAGVARLGAALGEIALALLTPIGPAEELATTLEGLVERLRSSEMTDMATGHAVQDQLEESFEDFRERLETSSAEGANRVEFLGWAFGALVDASRDDEVVKGAYRRESVARASEHVESAAEDWPLTATSRRTASSAPSVPSSTG